MYDSYALTLNRGYGAMGRSTAGEPECSSWITQILAASVNHLCCKYGQFAESSVANFCLSELLFNAYSERV